LTRNLSKLLFIGTGGWKSVESTVNVPEDTTVLAFGILLSGKYHHYFFFFIFFFFEYNRNYQNFIFTFCYLGGGEAWLDDCSFEIVDPPIESAFPVPLVNPNFDNTGMLPYPINLSF
jgi:hypothetical protein